ncbi:MAG TPA: helix-hairpin-helix domain-containing protein, partial [Spirochaetota bacterium]|nr:helix-hairpin-helix domain-containing protein [Spirochaetota bacterium]
IEKSDGGVIAVVEDDQYKLAVGRNGHNARLSVRLCGFEIDIKTEDQYREFLSSSESRALVEKLFATPAATDETPLDELPGLDARTIKLLEAGKIFSVEDLVEASFEDLMKIDGIGEKTAVKIQEILREFVDFDEDEDEEEAESEAETGAGTETGAEAGGDTAAEGEKEGTEE